MKSTLPSTILLLTLCSACSTDDSTREYEITGDPCGTKDAAAYEFLFPPGKEMTTNIIGDVESGSVTCQTIVDEVNAFEGNLDPVFENGGINAAKNILAPGADMESSEQVDASPYEARVWTHRAIAYAECESSNFDYMGIGVSLDVSAHNEGDHTDDLAAIIDEHVEDRLAQIDPAYCATSANS